MDAIVVTRNLKLRRVDEGHARGWFIDRIHG